MRTKILILGLICLFLMSCTDIPDSPYTPKFNLPNSDGYAKVEMMGRPSAYAKVYIGNDTGPYFGFGGATRSGIYRGILKNTGTKTVMSVRLTINYFGEGEFLGQAVMPSWPVFSEFWEYGELPNTYVYFSDCTLKPNAEVKWRAFLLHEGNDWRTKIVWSETQFIIEWDETS